MSPTILCVDDDPNVLAAYQRNLRKQFSIDVALGAEEALALIEQRGPYAVIVADMRMPGMDGIQLLTCVQQKAPDTVRIMLTGNADQRTAIEAVNRGHVYQFLTKPCRPEMLALALDAGVRQYRLICAERELLEKTFSGAINVLTEMLSLVAPEAFGRGRKLREYMRTFAQFLKIHQLWELEAAAMLSQVGCMTIPPSVISKVQAGHALTGEEKDMIARIPQIGADLLGHIPRLESVAEIVLYQNKHFDGGGFPADNRAGEDIPVGARIIKGLSDLIELESRGIAKAQALQQMQQRPGWYDPRVLDAAFASFDVYLEKPTHAASQPIKANELTAGQILAANVETIEGVLIVGAGQKISPVLLERLRNFARLGVLKEPVYVAAPS